MEEVRNIKFSLENLKQIDFLEDLDIDGEKYSDLY